MRHPCIYVDDLVRYVSLELTGNDWTREKKFENHQNIHILEDTCVDEIILGENIEKTEWQEFNETRVSMNVIEKLVLGRRINKG